MSGQSRRSRDPKGKGKAKMHQLEAQLKEQSDRMAAEKVANRRMLAMIIVRTEGKTIEEAYDELDRLEAETSAYEQGRK